MPKPPNQPPENPKRRESTERRKEKRRKREKKILQMRRKEKNKRYILGTGVGLEMVFLIGYKVYSSFSFVKSYCTFCIRNWR